MWKTQACGASDSKWFCIWKVTEQKCIWKSWSIQKKHPHVKRVSQGTLGWALAAHAFGPSWNENMIQKGTDRRIWMSLKLIQWHSHVKRVSQGTLGWASAHGFGPSWNENMVQKGTDKRIWMSLKLIQWHPHVKRVSQGTLRSGPGVGADAKGALGRSWNGNMRQKGTDKRIWMGLIKWHPHVKRVSQGTLGCDFDCVGADAFGPFWNENMIQKGTNRRIWMSLKLIQWHSHVKRVSQGTLGWASAHGFGPSWNENMIQKGTDKRIWMSLKLIQWHPHVKRVSQGTLHSGPGVGADAKGALGRSWNENMIQKGTDKRIWMSLKLIQWHPHVKRVSQGTLHDSASAPKKTWLHPGMKTWSKKALWQKNMDEPQANSMTSPCEKSQPRHTAWFSFSSQKNVAPPWNENMIQEGTVTKEYGWASS